MPDLTFPPFDLCNRLDQEPGELQRQDHLLAFNRDPAASSTINCNDGRGGGVLATAIRPQLPYTHHSEKSDDSFAIPLEVRKP